MGTEWRYGVGAFAPIRTGASAWAARSSSSLGVANTGATGLGRQRSHRVDGRGPLRRSAANSGPGLGGGGGTRLSAGYAPDFRLVALIGYAFPVADTDPGAPAKRFQLRGSQGQSR